MQKYKFYGYFSQVFIAILSLVIGLLYLIYGLKLAMIYFNIDEKGKQNIEYIETKYIFNKVKY
jgi:hypothetical protein